VAATSGRACCEQRVDACLDRAPGRDHVIDDEARAIRDISDDVGEIGFGTVQASLMQYSQRNAEALRIGAGDAHAAHVRRNDHGVTRQPATNDRLAAAGTLVGAATAEI
jgi:hypothetical protein